MLHRLLNASFVALLATSPLACAAEAPAECTFEEENLALSLDDDDQLVVEWPGELRAFSISVTDDGDEPLYWAFARSETLFEGEALGGSTRFEGADAVRPSLASPAETGSLEAREPGEAGFEIEGDATMPRGVDLLVTVWLTDDGEEPCESPAVKSVTF